MASPAPDQRFRAVPVSTEDSAITGLRKASTRNQDQQRHRRPEAPGRRRSSSSNSNGAGVGRRPTRKTPGRHGLACPLGLRPPQTRSSLQPTGANGAGARTWPAGPSWRWPWPLSLLAGDQDPRPGARSCCAVRYAPCRRRERGQDACRWRVLHGGLSDRRAPRRIKFVISAKRIARFGRPWPV
jgi:hypothetical protein